MTWRASCGSGRRRCVRTRTRRVSAYEPSNGIYRGACISGHNSRSPTGMSLAINVAEDARRGGPGAEPTPGSSHHAFRKRKSRHRSL